jgi:hypothetical protein
MIKALRVFFAPSLERLEGAKVAEGALRDLAVVELEIVIEGHGKFGGAVEAGASEQVGDAAVEALHHPVGLRAARRDEAMRDALFGTGLAEPVAAGGFALALGGEAVGEFLAVIGQDLLDPERAGLSQAFQKVVGALGGLVGPHLEVDPAAGAVDGDAQVGLAGLTGQFGQLLEIDVKITGRVVLEGLFGAGFALLGGDEVGFRGCASDADGARRPEGFPVPATCAPWPRSDSVPAPAL